MSSLTVLLWCAIIGFLLLALIFFRHPELLIRVIVFLLRHTFIRLKIEGQENIPRTGAVLIVSNHVSLLDLLLIQAASRRSLHFMMAEKVFQYLPFKSLLRSLGMLSVPSSNRPKAMHEFFLHVRAELRCGNALCLFPEGGVSGSGGLMRFRSNVKPFLPSGTQVTIVPMRIGMLWGRLLTVADGTFRIKFPRRIPVDYNIKIGKPVSPELSSFQLRQRISELGAEAEMGPQADELPLHTRFLLNAKLHPFGTTFIDADTGPVRDFKILTGGIILSKVIRSLDCGSSGYVGVLLPNCSSMIAMLLGVLYSDHTPAVLNFSAGEEVAVGAARRAGVTLILTSRKFIKKLGWEPTPEMVFAEDFVKRITPALKRKTLLQVFLIPRYYLAKMVAPQSVYNVHREAVLLFSSGTTGTPKAVMLCHRNINSDIWSFWRIIDWSPRDRMCGNLPIFHAFGFMVGFAFPCFSRSSAIFFKNPLESQAIVDAIRKYKITIMASTPTFLQNYMRKAKPEDFTSLRLAVTGAEKLRPQLAENYRNFTGRDIIEGYGCTELSPIVSLNVCNSIFQLGKHAEHPGSIGIPLPGVHVRAIDCDTGAELEANQPGRLQVKGGLVMKGYLNDPQRTAQVLQNSYYDTGDIGKIDEDGYIYITGRASRFSKIGGEMVPHESIEDIIAKFRNRPEREVAVTGRADAKRGERLVVFYTASDLDPAEVINVMREQKLPNLWIPKAEDFVQIEALPMTGTGKLDLKQLKIMADQLN